eukprot:NODE_1473_length_2464_cov_9.888746.p1 GENE.NODE_1473_length_2464_cov_9.888746~~NODE_1473_length_2464_cov_9.888746.p1  ORF type:complete len:722 (-),score=166.92 NODE_1473_length_2464_cov_9.888746:298-2325(-)
MLLAFLPFAICVLPGAPQRRPIKWDELAAIFADRVLVEKTLGFDDGLREKYKDFINREHELYESAQNGDPKDQEAYLDVVRGHCLKDLIPNDYVNLRWYFAMLLQCAWFAWLAIFPWVYIGVSGEWIFCHTNVACVSTKYHISGITPVLSWIACIVVGFRYTQAIADSACSAVCSIKQYEGMHAHPWHYIKPIHQVTQKLTYCTDELSHFPAFTSSTTSACVKAMPLPLKIRAKIFSASFFLGFFPAAWMQVVHKEKPLDAEPIIIVAIVTSSIGLMSALLIFLERYERVLMMYRFAVDQTFVIAYIMARARTKQSPSLRKIFQNTSSKLDKTRHEQHNLFLKTPCCAGLRSIPDVELKGSVSVRRRWLSADDQVSASVGPSSISEELNAVHQHGIVFNFHTPEGILLFRRLRQWLDIDILNDRTSIELFVTMSILYITIVLTFVIVFYFLSRKEITCITVFGVLSAMLTTNYLFMTLNLCVNANDFLFTWPPKLLAEWEQALWVGARPFSGQRTTAAWIWHTADQRLEGINLRCQIDFEFAIKTWEDFQSCLKLQPDVLAKGKELCAQAYHSKSDQDMKAFVDLVTAEALRECGPHDDPAAMELLQNRHTDRATAECLSNLVRRIEKYEKRQSILGLRVTAALRMRIVISLASAFAPMMITALKELVKMMQAHT